MRRGNILLCVTLITLLAPSSPVNKWFSSFGPLQVGATCYGPSYAARNTSRGYRLCFQDTTSQPNLCKTAGKNAWGYVVPPPASTGRADLLLRPSDGICGSPAKVVGTATFSCTANQYDRAIRVTLVITNNVGASLTSQRIFIGCKGKYLDNCPTLDAANTTDCTGGNYAMASYGLGYRNVPTCGGDILNTCGGPVICNGNTKTITINVNPSASGRYLTGCDDCRSFWWAVKEEGNYNCP